MWSLSEKSNHWNQVSDTLKKQCKISNSQEVVLKTAADVQLSIGTEENRTSHMTVVQNECAICWLCTVWQFLKLKWQKLNDRKRTDSWSSTGIDYQSSEGSIFSNIIFCSISVQLISIINNSNSTVVLDWSENYWLTTIIGTIVCQNRLSPIWQPLMKILIFFRKHHN